MSQTDKTPVPGCSCVSDPFADLPPELRPAGGDEAAKQQRFGLRKVTCPGCGLVYTTNRATDLCIDCERKGVKVPPQTTEEGETIHMLSIKVLGPGCSKCDFLEQRTRQALEEIKAEHPGLDATIEKIGDIDVFMEYGLMMTPGLVINDKLVCAGRVATASTIAGWMREALNGSA
jgi:small redox-active disulfide protein 2